MNLNGLWDFTVLPREPARAAPPPDGAFQERILVPFPVESALSGISREVTPSERVWYRKRFRLPEEGERSRWLVHFGAVDWEAEVFLNGRSLGTHRGGYDPFSFEITDALLGRQEQELVVAVWDPSDEGDQPRGKQVLEPHGIWYTAVTGIWQTVWLEPVPEAYIDGLAIVPDLGAQSVTVTVSVSARDSTPEVRVTAGSGGPGEGARVQARGRAGQAITLEISSPRLWSPDDPFLYDLSVELEGGDVVQSYFAMRSISIGSDSRGHPRLLLNGRPLFQLGLLDQGWWPDGLYTAPSDEALLFDVHTTKALGYNLIRKHVKVEPARWYFHADREGLLVWQDMPSGNNRSLEGKEQFAHELQNVVDALRNHPSIVMWVPFNEGWGQHQTEEYVEWLRGYDPSRLVNNASGWTDTGVGDVLDIHRYPGPGAPDALEAGDRVPVLGEFGGLGLPVPGHTWVQEDNWGYRSFESPEGLREGYRELLHQLRAFVGDGLAAAVYTQTTDVEVEVNGVMTYDREIVKLGESAFGLHQQLLGPPPDLRPLVPTSRLHPQVWRYSTDAPTGDWVRPEFDDGGWPQGPGGFGSEGTPGSRVRTVWDTPELWLRRTFDLGAEELEGLEEGRLCLRIHHDEDAEVYLNGIQIAALEGYTSDYQVLLLDPSM
ncbi:glycoside hydrolase family 2 protein, partial [Gemmatimonadota bacterium]